MSLAEVLEKIRKAKYGREIREAIAQGIEISNDISNEALSQTKVDAETLTNELFNCEQFKTRFNLDIVIGSAIATNRGFTETLAENISSNTLLADGLLGNQYLWNELGEGTYMVSAFARNNTFGRDFASNSVFVNGLANNNTFGSAFASNTAFVNTLVSNAEFGRAFTSNTGFINNFLYALSTFESVMAVPIPTASDAGKILVATSSSGASWVEI